MTRPLVLCGLGLAAFVVTLAFSFGHENLWRLGPAAAAEAVPVRTPPATRMAAAPPRLQLAPAIAAADPAVATSLHSEQQSPAVPSPDVEGVEMARRDLRAGHGSRSH